MESGEAGSSIGSLLRRDALPMRMSWYRNASPRDPLTVRRIESNCIRRCLATISSSRIAFLPADISGGMTNAPFEILRCGESSWTSSPAANTSQKRRASDRRRRLPSTLINQLGRNRPSGRIAPASCSTVAIVWPHCCGCKLFLFSLPGWERSGKLSKRPALNLFSQRKIEQSITLRTARAFAQVGFEFSIRADI